MTKVISLKEVVGGGYNKFWNCKKRYLVCKGSRASKKSKTTALRWIHHLMKYPGSNLLVVRKVAVSLQGSCWTELKWAANRLGVAHLWKFTSSPLEAVYIPTGQKIYFRGMDDPLKITSITVEVGCLCWLWVEEAYEITKEEDFNLLDESIRGEVPEGLWKQAVLTFNPWSDKSWIKKRFFDTESDLVLAMTTNYMCNEWLDDADRAMFEDMRVNRPKRYKVAGLGDWGIIDGVIYEDWEERDFSLAEIKKAYPAAEALFGLDFGYTNDPTALFCGLYDEKSKQLWVFDEMYEKGLSNKKIHEGITRKGYSKERITGDSAEPKSIDELRGLGLKIKGAVKGKDSIKYGIQFIQDLHIIVHPRCANFITEISNYTWDRDKFDNPLNVPIDDFNHLMDAMRYALEKKIRNRGWMY